MDALIDATAACAHELFERQAARTPAAVAVVHARGRLTYRQLNEQANRLARHLRRQGVGPEQRVGICMDRSPRMLVALLGVWKAGGAYVPLDPGYPGERLAFMCGDAGLRLLLTDGVSSPRLPAATTARRMDLDADWPSLADEDTADLPSGAAPANLAYVMYTSGSTGTPKGAMITHAGLANYLRWAVDAYGIAAGGSVPLHSSLSFDLTVTSLYPPLLSGAHVELLAEDAGAQNLLAALRAKKRSLLKITPAHLELLNRQLRPEELAGMVDTLVIGGESLLAESLAAWREHAPTTRIINEYGPTETVVGCCAHTVCDADPAAGALPIGRPIANTRLYVLDAALQPLPPGGVGELYIGGAGVARGYLNRPELTQARFLPDPFSAAPGARMYRSGDLARYRAGGDGVLECLGRLDHQVKIRGYRIELGEIEHALARHPDVRSCVVVARDGQQLSACLIARDGRRPQGSLLRAFLQQRLPDHMVPQRFIWLDDFPLTPNGKVDRQALQDAAQEERSAPATVAAPRTDTEAAVMRVFHDILGHADCGVADNFFDLGGHSLMAVRLLSRLRDATGTNLSLRNLFEYPTAAGLAGVIDGLAWSAAAATDVAAPRHGAAQHEEFSL